MIIYLSLKQLILNQINVLLRKKDAADPKDDDFARLTRRLSHLQNALEQIKSYSHNQHFEYVIRHFDIELTDQEQADMHALSLKFDDPEYDRRVSKSGFTTTRSETLFTGAAEERYDYDLHPSDDEKSGHANHSSLRPPAHGHGQTTRPAPRWLHYRGFAHWLKKQSFVRFKRRNDQKKFEAIWRAMLALKFTDGWTRGRITNANIIGARARSASKSNSKSSKAKRGSVPVLDIYSKCGSRQCVKASLLRLSITNNRIFKFDLDVQTPAQSHRNESTARSKTRARGSIDMDEDDEALKAAQSSQTSPSKSGANVLVSGRDLFDSVSNKDVLRVVATMLWDKGLADNVLQEFMQNPRFSMCGNYGNKLAAQIRQEMGDGDEDSTRLREEEKSPSASAASSASPMSGQYLGTGSGGKGKSYEYDRASTPTIQEEPEMETTGIEQFSLEQGMSASPGYHAHPPELSASPTPTGKGQEQPKHRPQSASVVFHDNIRDSQIYDNGDEEDSHSGHDYESDSDQ